MHHILPLSSLLSFWQCEDVIWKETVVWFLLEKQHCFEKGCSGGSCLLVTWGWHLGTGVSPYTWSSAGTNDRTLKLSFFTFILEYSIPDNVCHIHLSAGVWYFLGRKNWGYTHVKFRRFLLITWNSDVFSSGPVFSLLEWSTGWLSFTCDKNWVDKRSGVPVTCLHYSSWNTVFLMNKNGMLFCSKVECYIKEFVLIYQNPFRV